MGGWMEALADKVHKQGEIKSQLRSKQSAKAPLPKNSLATGGCFERNTYLITALGWLKEKERKKERKKMNNSDFDRFRFATLK